MKRKDLQYKADADRALTDDELRAIWRATDRMTYPFGPYFKLMILTGQRRNEVQEEAALFERRPCGGATPAKMGRDRKV